MISAALCALVLLLLLPAVVLAHTVPGLNVLSRQLQVRSEPNLIDSIYDFLPRQDTDFITYNLKNLTKFNGTKCDECKNRLLYGKELLKQYPQKKHLISLLLFKYCMIKNNNDESACDNVDFFVTTQSHGDRIQGENQGVTGTRSVDLFDNDFLHMLAEFNTTSDLDMEYYCYFKAKKACKLPLTPNVDKLFGMLSWWPEKQLYQFQQPEYNNKSLPFHVLHLSDLHTQARYTMGSESNCTNAGLCCVPELVNTKMLPNATYDLNSYFRSISPHAEKYALSFFPDAKYANNGSYIPGDYYDYPKYRGLAFALAPAMTFGMYNCDTPAVLLNSTMQNVVSVGKDKDFEFTIFTGDLVDHDLLNCDPQETRDLEVSQFKILKHYLKDLPVYPSLGNHDTFPYGQLSPINSLHDNVYNWNDELMSEIYVENGWLPELKRNEIKSHYSGFSVVTDRGLKIISLNSNCYYIKNMWGYINMTSVPDLFGQWEFLVDELVQSEASGQRVWIIAHIPPYSDALPMQSQIFSKIVERFSPYTVANIFFGHTHRDQFNILYSTNSSSKLESDIVNMAWVLQSVTPLVGNNPSWKYYQVEDKSFNILNSYNYYTQLNNTFVNGGKEPVWEFEYSARTRFDPDSQWNVDAPLNATFWHKFVVEKLAQLNNTHFHQIFSDTQYRQSPLVPHCLNGTNVSRQCWDENYCITSNFGYDEYNKCISRPIGVH